MTAASSEQPSAFSKRVRAHWVVAAFVALLAVGGALRFSGLDDALVHFHSTRQFHCAIIARGMFYGWTRPPDDPRRRVAEAASDRRGRLEPPLVQALAALGYAAMGREHMAVPRVIGIAAWLAAAVFLYLLAKRLALGAASLVAAGYWLLVPFGVVASQSFQPDPLMMLAAIASYWLIVRHDLAPRRAALIAAGLVSGFALLTKPVCGFGIALLYGVLALRRVGLLALLRSAEPWLFAILLATPSALWYLPELLGDGRLGGQAESSFRPELYATPEYWHGWLDKLLEVLPGPWLLGLALLGLLLAPAGRVRAALWALWGGYVAYGLCFNYHISSHNYYQLPVFPIVGLSLAALIKRLELLAPRRVRLPSRVAVAAAAVGAGIFAVQEARAHAWPETHNAPDPDVRGYRNIGELVQHSTKVIFLTPHSYGGPLEYRGELSGWYWPCEADLRRARRRKKPPFDWRARFDELSHQGAEYFVSTPADELTKQRPLGRMLRERYRLLSSSDKYLVYDLRAPL